MPFFSAFEFFSKSNMSKTKSFTSFALQGGTLLPLTFATWATTPGSHGSQTQTPEKGTGITNSENCH